MDWEFLWKAVAAVAALISVVVALSTYDRTRRTKMAEFLLSLHKSFFVDETYQPMKALLDCDGAADELKLAAAVREETAEFTDFLNFFELIAYFVRAKTLSREDVEALLGYYLDKLRAKEPVWDYIRQSSKSFENLKRLLEKRPIE